MSRPHFAPAVSYSVAPTRLLALALGLSWFLSAAGLTALGLALVRAGQPNLPWQVLALALGGGGLGMAQLFWLRRRVARGWLIWQNGAWRLAPDLNADAPSGSLQVVLDVQRYLLLRFRVAGQGARGPSRWVWAARSAQPASWHAFRCAVYSSGLPVTGVLDAPP